VKSCRGIWSLLLLSAYVLLLLHDFIPHTHHEHQDNHQTVSLAQHDHSHAHDHQEHHHHEDQGTDDEIPSNPTENPFENSLIHSHSHSDFNGHDHELVYRTSSKSDLLPKLFKVQYLHADLWKFPDKLDHDYSGSFEFIEPPSSQYFSSGHGLRGPPALG